MTMYMYVRTYACMYLHRNDFILQKHNDNFRTHFELVYITQV